MKTEAYDLSDYPHKCPRCGSGAYIGLNKILCTGCCAYRDPALPKRRRTIELNIDPYPWTQTGGRLGPLKRTGWPGGTLLMGEP